MRFLPSPPQAKCSLRCSISPLFDLLSEIFSVYQGSCVFTFCFVLFLDWNLSENDKEDSQRLIIDIKKVGNKLYC